MPWVYWNDGRASQWRDVKDGVRADRGEVAFDAPATEDQLNLAFPQRAAKLKAESLIGPARAALDDSDRVVLRCYEAGVPVPADWVSYRKALRDIAASKSAADALPAQPAFPANA